MAEQSAALATDKTMRVHTCLQDAPRHLPSVSPDPPGWPSRQCAAAASESNVRSAGPPLGSTICSTHGCGPALSEQPRSRTCCPRGSAPTGLSSPSAEPLTVIHRLKLPPPRCEWPPREPQQPAKTQGQRSLRKSSVGTNFMKSGSLYSTLRCLPRACVGSCWHIKSLENGSDGFRTV